MDSDLRARPWYLHWRGIATLAYLIVTAALGIAFLVTSRRANSRLATDASAVRVGGFTETKNRAGSVRANVPFFTDSDPAIGATNPKLTIVEFGDFQCPYCRTAFPIIREAATTYGDRGVRFIYRDFPVDEIHAEALPAAVAAQCAHAQGKFWAYHDKLFQNQELLDAKSLAMYAQQIGLDTKQFNACLTTGQSRQEIQNDLDAGRALDVRGTPTWFFVFSDDPGNAHRIEGVIPHEALAKLLDRNLR